jgi:hypothetical protein
MCWRWRACETLFASKAEGKNKNNKKEHKLRREKERKSGVCYRVVFYVS